MLFLTRSTSPSSELKLTSSSSSSSSSLCRYCPSVTLPSLFHKHSLPLSRSSSNSSSKSNSSNFSSNSSSTSSSSSAASTPSSSPKLPLIDLIVLSGTPPLRRTAPTTLKSIESSSSRPRMQRRDTPAYRSPREGGGKTELKVGGWVGVVEEA
ncbi:hypothetical protein BDY24DRAFT_393465 [Mrakia frigida]|uniref:uncharacterized protein n=1 Tax=Mrakia frigida TaxID=29902 RepID=UPI003FCC015D